MVGDGPPGVLQARERLDVQAALGDDRALRVRRGDEDGSALREEARGVASHRAEALDRDPRPVERDAEMAGGHVSGAGEPEARRAELVERDPPQRRGQPDGAADLVVHPGHAGLVGAHVGAEHVVALVAERVREGANEPLLPVARHPRIAPQHRLPAPVTEARRRVLHRHRAREAEALVGRDIGRHAQAADRRAARHIVDDEDGLQAEPALLDMHDPGGAEIVADAKDIHDGVLPPPSSPRGGPGSAVLRLRCIFRGPAPAAAGSRGG